MPVPVAQKTKPGPSDQPSPEPVKGRSLTQWHLAVMVFIVVAVPAVVTYLLLSFPTSPGASDESADRKSATVDSDEPGGDGHGPDIVEVALGEFNISNRTAEPGIIYQVEFKLAAVTAAAHAQNLEAQVKVHSARIRQAITKIVTQSRLDELSDPTLGTIQQLIREDVNRLLGKSFVKDVTISDVTVNEM